MPFDQTSGQKLIGKLFVSKQKAHDLEILLRLKNNPDDAEKAAEKAHVLSQKIDQLLAKEMIEWLGESDKIIEDVGKANTSIKAAIEKIKNDSDVMQETVKAIGLIDDVINLAKSVLRP